MIIRKKCINQDGRDSAVGNSQLSSKLRNIAQLKCIPQTHESLLQIQEHPGRLCSMQVLKDPGCFDLEASSSQYVLSQQGKKQLQPLTPAVKCSGPHRTQYLQTQLIGQNKSRGSFKLGEDGEMPSFYMPKREEHWMWVSSMHQKTLPQKLLVSSYLCHELQKSPNVFSKITL